MFPTVAFPWPHRVDTLSNAEMTLHSQIMALESVNMNREVFSAMKDGKDAMNRAVVNMGGPDAVEELIDEVEEGIQARMANPNPNPDPNPNPNPDTDPDPNQARRRPGSSATR